MGTVKRKGAPSPVTAKAGADLRKFGKFKPKKTPEEKKRWRDQQAPDRMAYREALAARIAPALPAHATESPISLGDYTDELGQVLFAYVVAGNTLKTIASLRGMPALYIMLQWVGDTQHPFRNLYYEAKRLMVPFLEEQAMEAATQALIGTTTTRKRVYNPGSQEFEDSVEVREHDNVDRSRLIVDVIKWTLSYTDAARHGKQGGDGEGEDNLKALLGQFRTISADIEAKSE